MYAWITGINKQRKTLNDMADPKKHDAALGELVDKTATLMQLWCPRYRGYLEGTIHVKKNGVLDYTIWSPMSYGWFTEYGTRYIDIGTVESPKLVRSMSGKMSYRPWARPAVWHYINKYPEIMKGIVVSGI